MNPLASGVSLGVLLSGLSFVLLWTSLEKGMSRLLAWFVVTFMGKLLVVVAAIVIVHKMSGVDTTRPFAISLTLTVLLLLFAGLAACVMKLNRLEAEGAFATDGELPSEPASQKKEA